MEQSREFDTPVLAPEAGPAPVDPPYRHIERITRAASPTRGFAGPEHTAIEAFTSDALHLTDPFVMLMDDTLEFQPGQPIGAAHPHAGLETFTLVIEGALDDADEGLLEAGDAALMSAGRGVVHNERVRGTGHARILQLWIALPSVLRNAPPELQVLSLGNLPVRREPGVVARLYSGQSGPLTSSTRNRVAMTIVDFALEPYAAIDQSLPATQTGLLYVLAGNLEASGEPLSRGDLGWFGTALQPESRIHLRAGAEGARVFLYAGRPLREPILHHGPFVAGSRHELAAYIQNHAAGHFDTIGRLAARSGARAA
mgnify:CR=1 FL=1